MRLAVFLIVLTVVPFFAQSTARAAETADNMKVQRDIAYAEPKGSDKALTSLDVYSPVSGKDHPIMVWIHGGGWTKGDKAQVALKPKAFVERGFVLVSLNYRLVPAVNFKGQTGDIAQAIRWVHHHAKDYGGSPDRIFVMGHSAGAHLAALVATDDRYLKSHELPLTTIKGVILLDGAGYDFARRIEGAGPEAKKSFEAVFGTEKNAIRDASPVNFIAKGKGIPPFLIIHVADRAESKAQSAILADALRNAGVVAEVVPAPGKTHGTLNQEFGRPGDQPTKAVFNFLDNLKKK